MNEKVLTSVQSICKSLQPPLVNYVHNFVSWILQRSTGDGIVGRFQGFIASSTWFPFFLIAEASLDSSYSCVRSKSVAPAFGKAYFKLGSFIECDQSSKPNLVKMSSMWQPIFQINNSEHITLFRLESMTPVSGNPIAFDFIYRRCFSSEEGSCQPFAPDLLGW